MKDRLIWCAMFGVCCVALWSSPALREFFGWNAAVQAAIFVLCAHLPAWRRGLLSYVDFAWPAGLLAIGAQLFVFAREMSALGTIAAAMYALAGLRMALWAAHMYVPGVLTRDLPRYQYQRRRWERAGFRSERFSIQYEIAVQGMANIAFLALPAYLIAAGARATIGVVEGAAIGLWVFGFVFESLADLQKRRYLAASQGRREDVCEVGLWRYSRHPNYFGQWLQWIALPALAVPSLLALRASLHPLVFALLALSLAVIVHLLYRTLVHYTGAVPAEYYSRLKRPAYADYQARVNRFFPGARRETT